MTQEALKLALEALYPISHNTTDDPRGQADKAITAIKEALAQSEQEPVAWMLTDKNINLLQVDSIQRLIDRLKHAHHTDLCVRINGQDEWFQADWLKHMVRVTPPQRTWVGLTDEEQRNIAYSDINCWDWGELMDATEAKLKQKNGYAEKKNT
jgi:hypothetical protein